MYSVEWGKDGKIAVACGDNTIRLIVRKGSSNIPAATIKTQSEPNSVSLNPKVNLLAAGFDDGSVSIYEISHDLVSV